MPLILMIAAGILLAVLLLPFLGTIVLAALSVAYYLVIILLICAGVVLLPSIIRGIFTMIGVGAAGVDAAKKAAETAKVQSLMGRVRSDPEFTQGLEAGLALGELAGLRGPGKLWYRYLLGERFRNCGYAGLFRVEDGLNRSHLERLLSRTARRCAPGDAERAGELCRTALDCHDSLCQQYVPKHS